MPYLQVDVDALDDFDRVEAIAALPEGRAYKGCLRLWLHCWKKKADRLPREVVASFFVGSDPGRVIGALVVCGFATEAGEDLVIRGAAKRLGIRKAQSESGKSKAGNLKQFRARAGDGAPGRPGDDPVVEPEVQTGSTPALTSSIQHPASNLKEEEEEEQHPPPQRASVPFVVEAPGTPPEEWLGDDFWRWAQAKRQKAGWIAERPPNHRKVSGWWSEAAMSGADVGALKEAFYGYGNDPHWQNKKPPLPFVGFMDVWRNYLPRRKAS